MWTKQGSGYGQPVFASQDSDSAGDSPAPAIQALASASTIGSGFLAQRVAGDELETELAIVKATMRRTQPLVSHLAAD